MQVSRVRPSYPTPPARAAAVPPVPGARAVRAADGPPPEYSLWAILKDLGSRLGAWFRGLFGRD